MRRRPLLLLLALALLVAAGALLWRKEPSAQTAKAPEPVAVPWPALEPPAPAPAGRATAYVEVLSHNGSPVVGARVRVRAGAVERRGVSDESGHAELEGLPPGLAQLEVAASGYAPVQRAQPLPDGLDAVSWTVTLAADDEATGAVRGVVVSGGSPVPRALVIASERGRLDATHAVFSGEDGRFMLPRQGFFNEVVAFHEAFGDGRAAAADEVVLELPAGGSVSGRVLDEAGRPVADAEVQVTVNSGPPGVRRALVEADGGGAPRERLSRLSPAVQQSDERGAFRVSPVAAGRVVVVASAAGKVPAQTEVEIPAGRERREVVLRLGAPVEVTGFITFRATGEPVKGARIDAVRTQAPEVPGFGTAVSDDEGRYRLLTSPTVRHSVSVRAKGYVSALQGGVRGRSGEQLRINFSLEATPPGDDRPGFRYVGIGAQLRPHAEGAAVGSVFKSGSATGLLQAGDIILRVDGIWTEGLSLAEIVELIVGEAGTDVELLVKSKAAAQPDRVLLSRQPVSSKG
jgi:hypothetical protein